MKRREELERLFKDNLPKGLPKATRKILEEAAEKFADSLQNYYELPCALGETVTDITEYFNDTENPQTYSFVAEKIAIEKDGDELVYIINNEAQYKKSDFGKTVFFGSDGIKQAEEARAEKEKSTIRLDLAGLGWSMSLEEARRRYFGLPDEFTIKF